MTSKPRFVGERVRLGDICEISSGGTPKRSNSEFWSDGNIPWVKISDITSKYVSTVEEFVTEEGLNSSSAKLFEPGTLLFSIFASIGTVGILDISACTNQAIAGIKVIRGDVDRDFLYHWLKTQQSASKSAGRGVAQHNINLTILRNMELTFPSLSTQKAIATQFNLVDELISIAKRQTDILDYLVKSRFVEMFGDMKENSMDWPVMDFDHFSTIDTKMTTDYEFYADYPHIGIDSIESETGAIGGYRTVRQDAVKSGKYPFTSEHIIYSKIRPALNKVAMPDFDGVCSADAYPILPNTDACIRVFLAYLMRSESVIMFCLYQDVPRCPK